MGKIIISVLATLMLLAMCGCNHSKKVMAYNAKVFKSLTMQKCSNSFITIKIDSTYGYLITNKYK